MSKATELMGELTPEMQEKVMKLVAQKLAMDATRAYIEKRDRAKQNQEPPTNSALKDKAPPT